MPVKRLQTIGRQSTSGDASRRRFGRRMRLSQADVSWIEPKKTISPFLKIIHKRPAGERVTRIALKREESNRLPRGCRCVQSCFLTMLRLRCIRAPASAGNQLDGATLNTATD